MSERIRSATRAEMAALERRMHSVNGKGNQKQQSPEGLRKAVSVLEMSETAWEREEREMDEAVRQQHAVSQVLFLASIGAVKRLKVIFDQEEGLVNCADYDQRTPLHIAASNGKLEVARLLLALGADPSPVDRWDGTPMHDAIKGDHPELVALIQGYEGKVFMDGKFYDLGEYNEVLASSATSNINKVSELLFAASAGELDAVKLIIQSDKGLKNCSDYDKRTPLHLASCEGQSNVVNWLLQEGANPSPVDRWGGTPLKDAMDRGHYEVVDILLKYKAKIFEGGHFITMDEHNSRLAMREINWEFPRSQLEDVPVGKRMSKAGAFGKVYTAKWRGTIVAVKELHEHLLDSEEALANFRTELSVFSSVAHPNIVQFLGACTTEQPYCIVEEYMPGGSLRDLIEGARASGQSIPLAKCLDICIHAACGMSYLHDKQPNAIIHRDLKPDNVLLDRGGRAKIADFGLSKSIARPSKSSNKSFLNTRYRMTSTGSFCYMPPEVFMNEPYSFKVDVYSFAMVMYELFECKMPYEEELKVWSFEELGTMACKGVRPYMRRSPMSVRQLISKMWETDPDKRPDFHAIVESLHNIKSSDEFQESAEVPAKTSCCTIS